MARMFTLAILVVVVVVGFCTPEKGCEEPCATSYGYACNTATGTCECDDKLCQAASPSCLYANGNNFGCCEPTSDKLDVYCYCENQPCGTRGDATGSENEPTRILLGMPRV